jgi:hypothetical protein
MPLRVRLSSQLFVVTAMLMLSPPLLPAQKLGGCPAIPSSPPDISLNLSLNGGQAVFQEGEIIALTVRYTTKTKGKFLLNNRGYDRSGRLDGMEVFCVEPEGGKDPLADYFNAYRAFMGGGLFSNQDLSRSPAIKIELNEWRSLPPGSYSVSVIGNRASVGTEKEWKSWNGAAIPLRSNPVAFRVERADPRWQTAQLAVAVRLLDSPRSAENEKKHAARVLRFLGSEDATRELVRRYLAGPRENSWDNEAGLFGSPFRATAIREMRAALRTARGQVREDFVDTLVTLELQSDIRFRPPRFDPKTKDIGDSGFDAYDSEHKRRVAKYMAEATAGKFR